MFTGQIRARTPSSTSVNSEDTLDEDVRRILNKYSKVITSSEDESEVCEARKSPQGEIVFSLHKKYREFRSFTKQAPDNQTFENCRYQSLQDLYSARTMNQERPHINITRRTDHGPTLSPYLRITF